MASNRGLHCLQRQIRYTIQLYKRMYNLVTLNIENELSQVYCIKLDEESISAFEP